MNARGHRLAFASGLVLVAGTLSAAVVHVREVAVVDGVETLIGEREFTTGSRYETELPPELTGCGFTHWTINAAQPLDARDAWGRARGQASFVVYEDVVAFAHYLPLQRDEDRDGVADAREIYWYGDLSQNADSDSDGDGVGFAQELARGTNPLFAEECDSGRVLSLSGRETLYNPNGYAPYVVRSEPEGALFETRYVHARPGDLVETETLDPSGSTFAYWTVNGARMSDAWGVASNSVRFVASDRMITECVAHAIGDGLRRNAFYWYGREAAADSDVDGDGYTFMEELSRGLSPVFPDAVESGRVLNYLSEEVLFNPFGYIPYTIRSEPEGVLFDTISDWRQPGEAVSTPAFSPENSAFAYWTVGGVRQQDAWGVALDAVTFAAQTNELTLVAVGEADEWRRRSLYWYGTPDHGADSDVDDDGYTFAEELRLGLSPTFADAAEGGRVVAFDSESVEVSLQAYERVAGVVLDGEYVSLFDSKGPNGDRTGRVLLEGEGIWPVVVDLNGDGLFDVVVEGVTSGRRLVFMNVGVAGNPQFRTTPWNAVWTAVVEAARVRSVGGVSFDVAPEGALSFTFAGDDLLASDAEGRIWCYKAAGGANDFTLQHKVWGGTYRGFADDLRIAAVDWEDDGDWDCLCGTGDGRLMLLRDPKIGRPANVRVLAGVDNALLEWDANAQSRVMGYKVYRGEAEHDAFASIAETQLPRHRDFPEIVCNYDYRITSLSRFYTVGNSTPTVTESMPTEAVRAELGRVAFHWGNAAALAGSEVRVALGIDNSFSLAGTGLTLTVGYDSDLLVPVCVERSGLTEGVAFSETREDGMWRVVATNGTVAVGSGALFTFVFETKSASEDVKTRVSLTEARFASVRGAQIPAVLPIADAEVTISPKSMEESIDDPTVVAPYGRGDVDGDGRLTKEDAQLMARLMNGGSDKKWIAAQLQAGDYNGNGTLDNGDYQLMRADFREKGVLK